MPTKAQTNLCKVRYYRIPKLEYEVYYTINKGVQKYIY